MDKKTIDLEETKSPGEITLYNPERPEDPPKKIAMKAMIRLLNNKHDGLRDLYIVQLADGTYVYHFQSQLKENNFEKVVNDHKFTEISFIQLLTGMFIAAEYFGINLPEKIKELESEVNKGHIDISWAGKGTPKICSQTPEDKK